MLLNPKAFDYYFVQYDYKTPGFPHSNVLIATYRPQATGWVRIDARTGEETFQPYSGPGKHLLLDPKAVNADSVFAYHDARQRLEADLSVAFPDRSLYKG